jgi:hypothetical protein
VELLKMPRIYIADRTGDNLDGSEPKRIINSSRTELHKLLRQHPDTTWTVNLYNFKTDVETVIQLIEDYRKIKPEEIEKVRVNSSGQIRGAD